MSRALASVPVRQFRNFAGPETCGPIDASQDTCMGASIQYLIPSRPGELGANAFTDPGLDRPGSETSGDRVLLVPSAARASFGGECELTY